MRKVQFLSILAALLVWSVGCNSAPAPANTAEPRPDAVTAARPAADDNSGDDSPRPAKSYNNDGRPVLVCFGDSLTAGAGTEPGQSYPDYLQKDLDQLHYGYYVVNEGVSGNTTKDGVERLPEVLALHPAIAVVEFGGNDGLRGVPIEVSRANLDEIVRTLQQAGIKVVIAGITLPPDYGPDYIARFNETYTVLAKKYHVPMLPFLLQNAYGSPGMMQRDGIHATSKGNQVVARNVLQLVQPILKK